MPSLAARFTAPEVPEPKEHPLDRTWPNPTSLIERPGRGTPNFSL
jgi:hypothetical protein